MSLSLVGNNAIAVMAAAETAKELGYNPVILGTEIEGEASEIARVYVAMAQYLQKQNDDDSKSGLAGQYAMAKLPAAIIGGGETTVSLPKNNSGIGGRNQELALASAVAMRSARLRQIVLASVGTDGSDGPTDAAGGMVDGGTLDRLPGNPLDYLSRHDAYNYLVQEESSGVSPLVKVSSVIAPRNFFWKMKPLLPCSCQKTGPTGTNVADVCITLVQKKLI